MRTDKIKKEKNENGRAAALPIFLCWLAYTMAYMGRYSYASNITAVMERFGTDHSAAGLVSTCFFFAYGVGQVINGILCRRYPKRQIIALALIVSAVLNLMVFCGIPFQFIKYLWLLNGLAQSVLWSTLICILSENLRAEDLEKAVVAMSTTVPIGTFLSYGFSALMATVGGFMYSFLCGAVLMSAAAVVWFVCYKKAFRGRGVAAEEKTALQPRKKADSSLLFLLAVLCLLAVANNLVKDGLTTWIPSILKENFSLPESLSILLTLVLPVLGFFGAASNTVMGRKIKSFVSMSGIWYALTAVCVGLVIGLMRTDRWIFILISFGLVSLCMHAVNNLITSMAPLYLRERANSGLIAGVLNGCCYVGSTVSSYGLGAVADRRGWNGVFYLLLAVSIAAALISAAAAFAERRAETAERVGSGT